jgi:hypothetical protein
VPWEEGEEDEDADAGGGVEWKEGGSMEEGGEQVEDVHLERSYERE